MTVNELMDWCQEQPSQRRDEEVMVYKGPVVGYAYLDEDDLKVGDEDGVDGIHPWLKG